MSAPDRQRRHRQGLRAETLAAFYLQMKFYRIRARRYKTPVGEIDLVARRGRVVAFIEVKNRAHHDDGLFAVTPAGQARIARAAEHYLARYPDLASCTLRFDVVTVRLPFSVRHLENAWRI